MKYPFSFIIGYRHSYDRINNLRRVIDWLNGYELCQIILVEQDSHSKIEELNLNVNQHIFIKNKGSFNKSWGFNVGLEYVQSSIVCFGDADILMDPREFWNSLKMLSEVECVNPYSKVIDLNMNESRLPLEQIIKIDRPGRGEEGIQKTPFAGGIVLFRIDSIYKIGGWNEDFRGWGGEDDYQSIKIMELLTHKEMSYNAFHLYHNKAQIVRDEYHKNLAILDNVKTLSKDNFIKNIEKSKLSLGKINKYE